MVSTNGIPNVEQLPVQSTPVQNINHVIKINVIVIYLFHSLQFFTTLIPNAFQNVWNPIQIIHKTQNKYKKETTSTGLSNLFKDMVRIPQVKNY